MMDHPNIAKVLDAGAKKTDWDAAGLPKLTMFNKQIRQ
jgi:hypothetical protein